MSECLRIPRYVHPVTATLSSESPKALRKRATKIEKRAKEAKRRAKDTARAEKERMEARRISRATLIQIAQGAGRAGDRTAAASALVTLHG